MSYIKLTSLVTTPSVRVHLPNDPSMAYINIHSGNGIDPMMSASSIASYFRSLLRHVVLIPSPIEVPDGAEPHIHSDYVVVATSVMQAMSKRPCKLADVDRPHAYRVVIGCHDPIDEELLDKRCDEMMFDTIGGPHSMRDRVVGLRGGIYILTFEEMIVFLIRFVVDPRFSTPEMTQRHQTEHDRKRLRRYSFITTPLHMMYLHLNNIPRCNWLPTHHLNLHVSNIDNGSHKYSPLVNHIHAYHRIAERLYQWIELPDDGSDAFTTADHRWRVFIMLAMQSCSANISSSNACASVRIRNAMIVHILSKNRPLLVQYLGNTALIELYHVIAHKVMEALNVLLTRGCESKFYFAFFEFVTHTPMRAWVDASLLTYRKTADHFHMTPLVIEVFTAAEMAIKCELDEDIDAYVSLLRDANVNANNRHARTQKICLRSRDHHRPITLEVEVEPAGRRDANGGMQHPDEARKQATLVMENARLLRHNEYVARVHASYNLRSTFDEQCRVFVVPGVSCTEMVMLCGRMMPILRLLLSSYDFVTMRKSIHTCIDSVHQSTSCFLVVPPTVMFLIATLSKLQMYRMLLDSPNEDQDESAILTSVMEVFAVSLQYVGVYGIWVLLHAFLTKFTMHRYNGDESKYMLTEASRLDAFGIDSPINPAYVAMETVVVVWRVVTWNRELASDSGIDGTDWKRMCDHLLHGLARNNQLLDASHKALLSRLSFDLNALLQDGVYQAKNAVLLLQRASHDWNQKFRSKETEDAVNHAAVPCVMRAINYHTSTAGDEASYQPCAAASAPCAFDDNVDRMLTLAEFLIGLNGSWMKNREHHTLFTSPRVTPSADYYKQLPVFYNNSVHPVVMRDLTALIRDDLFASAFTEEDATNVFHKFHNRTKQMAKDDKAAEDKRRDEKEKIREERHARDDRRRDEAKRSSEAASSSSSSSSRKSSSKRRHHSSSSSSQQQGGFSPGPPLDEDNDATMSYPVDDSNTHNPMSNMYASPTSPSYVSAFGCPPSPSYAPTSPTSTPPPQKSPRYEATTPPFTQAAVMQFPYSP